MSETQLRAELQAKGTAAGMKLVADHVSYATQIIALYQELLGRTADAPGLAHYNALLNQGYTLAWLREELKKSVEYINRQAAAQTPPATTPPATTPPATTPPVTTPPATTEETGLMDYKVFGIPVVPLVVVGALIFFGGGKGK